MRRGVGFAIATMLVLGLVAPVGGASAEPASIQSKIQKGLLARLDAGELDGFVVEFAAEADLRTAARTDGWVKRGATVYRSLVETAGRSQRQARALVRATPGARATTYWLTNVMVVQGGSRLASRLAGVPGVTKVRAERSFPLVEPVESHVVTMGEDEPPPWGITKIGADQAWADGVTGAGVVVANIDTGVEYTHEALVNQYRGNLGGGTFDNDYNWWDPTGICGDEPCDNAAHGTHTMGTMVGGDGPGPFTPDIGVAPGARWIAAKGCEDLFCSESALLSSGEFVIAPTDLDGNAPDPSKRPDIVNNSWGSGPGDEFYLEVVQAWRAAGIVPVFSSGNPGPACGDGGSPGDLLESFSAGATDEDDQIAEFSGRGPSVFGKVNPDVSAPGVDVVSSVPGGDYESFSGTSMAAPHTAGTLALVLSAEPALIGDVVGSTDSVRSTAFDILDDQCGGDDDLDPNNVYGDGRIDAAAAVALVATGGTLAGSITDVVTDDPIEGATIEAERGGRTYRATTDVAGHFALFLAAGEYRVSASAFGYQGGLATGVVIETDQTTTQDFVLAPLPRRDITGVVTAEEDGSPIEGAEVVALGTPVPPVRTAVDGSYTLTLPIGDFTIRTAAGGCTEADVTDLTLGLDGLTHDVTLFRTIDTFGHGCAPVAYDWVDAPTESALFGDQVFGRLTLPFAFPFYGQSYQRVFVTDNGYLTFEPADDPWEGAIPASFPSSREPNAAIYALWQNLVIDDETTVDYGTVGVAPDRAFVIEMNDLAVGPRFSFGEGGVGTTATARIDLEVKLWESGAIDVLYGDNPASPGDGRNAAIGVEAPGGSDGLVFGIFDDLVSAEVAYRYQVVPNGVVHGTVTDANDGLPVDGATVTATPGGRLATTAADGTYSLRLRPGTYTLTFAGRLYVDHVIEGFVVDDADDLTQDAALDGPVADVSPTEIGETVGHGERVVVPVTLDDPGAADLTWTLYERNGDAVAPELPPVPDVTHDATWARQELPARVESARVHALPPQALETIIDDPDDDAQGTVEITGVRGGSDETDMTMAIDFADGTPMDELVGYVHLDTDQDPETGIPPEWFYGLPSQDIGFDYFADLFAIHDPEPVVTIWDVDFNLVAEVPATIEGTTLSYTVPLEAFGEGEDGAIDTTMTLGVVGPEDWAPDEGHGTIRTFTDIPWLVPSATEGVVPAGGSDAIDMRLGTRTLEPGVYTGEVVLQMNAPRSPATTIDLRLEVRKPPRWGAASGFARDAHRRTPIADALVVIHAQEAGERLDLRAHADEEGAWSIQGPRGVWPMDVRRDGYLSASRDVSIVADETVGGQNALLHADVPHGTLKTAPIDLLVPAGRTITTVRVLRNIDGHRALEFTVGEAEMPDGPGSGGGGSEAQPVARIVPAGVDPDARTAEGMGSATVDATIADAGKVLATWPTEMSVPWGVGHRGETVTISDPEDLIDVEFTTEGERLGEYGLPWADVWGADMAWDGRRGLMWQVNVGGDNGIYGIDPTDGSVVDTITGDPWGDISQRGLAYDPATDTFYVGGWNEGIVYHVAGPSWPEPGATLDSCRPDAGDISGLAFNVAFQKLWVATNSRNDTIWLVDATTCETEAGIDPPGRGRWGGAGIELDGSGNIWGVSQNTGNAFLLESGLPLFSDVPWLSVRPGRGSVAPDRSLEMAIQVDTAGMRPGVHRGVVGVVTNDPKLGVALIPVRVAVSKYQRFVNVGGGPLSFSDGTTYVGDRRFTEGSFGYLGDTTVRKVARPIANARYPSVYRSQREGLTDYRFTVPDGRYLVELGFAEITDTREFGRVMDVEAHGKLVLNNLDVAGRVGRYRALDESFVVNVTNGMLKIGFDRAFGDPPILNAIRVTWLPEGIEP